MPRPKPFWTEIRCRSWTALTKQLNRCSGWIFRGQDDVRDKLTSSLERHLSKLRRLRADPWKYEAALLREFQRRAHQYESDLPTTDERLEWLALLRHYGGPTRLVDFSYSGFVAAHFALANCSRYGAAIWAIDQHKIRHAAVHPLKQYFDPVDFHQPRVFTRCFLEPPSKGTRTREVTLRSTVACVTPMRMNERLTIQQGLFVCPGDIRHSFMTNLAAIVRPLGHDVVRKLILPQTLRNPALAQLRRMNITSASLYPDLSGFASSLAERLPLLFVGGYDIPEHSLEEVVTWKGSLAPGSSSSR